jgi:hypothetical protein
MKITQKANICLTLKRFNLAFRPSGYDEFKKIDFLKPQISTGIAKLVGGFTI